MLFRSFRDVRFAPEPTKLAAVTMPEALMLFALRLVTVVTPSVDIPGVTVKLKNDGLSLTVTVAIPFGCGAAIAVILLPLKSIVVMLPAVPTTIPSS